MDENEKRIYELEKGQFAAKLKLAVLAQGIDSAANQAAEEYAQMKYERDYYKKQKDHADRAISDHYTYSSEQAEDAKQEANKIISLLESVKHERGALPAIVEYIYLSAVALTKENIEQYNQIINYSFPIVGDIANSADYPDLALIRAGKLRNIATSFNLISKLAIMGYLNSDDPRLTANLLVLECGAFGKPSIDTVRKLPIGWIRQNITAGHSISHETLHEALSHAWVVEHGTYKVQEIVNGKGLREKTFTVVKPTLGGYAERKSLNMDTLKRYILYLKKLEKLVVSSQIQEEINQTEEL